MSKTHNKLGFTLAEVLITLGIIGIVAALTIPGLLSRNEEKVRETQLKKAYSVLSQAHQMMIVKDIYPYTEFVEPFVVEEIEDTPGDETNPGGGDVSGSDDSEDNPPETIDPEQPGGEEPEQPGEVEEPDTGGETEDSSKPDMNDKTTKELVDGLIDAILSFPPDLGTAFNNFGELVDMYGFTNFGPFLKDYAEQSDIDLPDWMDKILGGDEGSNNSGNDSDSGSWWEDLFGGNDKDEDRYNNNKNRRNRSSYVEPVLYKQILANVTSSEDDMMENFITVKQYQLRVLKSLLNGAQYCESYDKCNGSVPVQYTNLNGNAVQMEVADFDNSALKTSDGMYIWLGDINNPQRYYVDINGSKRPNKLGVDVFTFDITPKQAILPERNDNCTKSGTPAGGEEYRGLGCTSYALTDYNPDKNAKGYWRNFK